MGKKLVVTISVLSFVLMIVVAGGIYYASTKITPQEIRTKAIEQIQNVFPNAVVELGEIDYSIGLQLKLSVNKLNLKINKPRRKADLISTKYLLVKIPWWSIITGGGTAEVEIDKPSLSYIEYNKTLNNWTYALSKKGGSSKTRGSSKQKKSDNISGKIVIPGFLAGLGLNFKLKNMLVGYKLYKGPTGSVDVSVFKIKNLNFEDETAFEINSLVSLDQGKDSKTSFNITIIGQINLKQFIEKQMLPVKLLVTLKNFKLPIDGINIPTIKTNLNLLLTMKNGESVKGSLETLFTGEKHTNKLAFTYYANTKKVEVSKLDVDILIGDLLRMVSLKAPITLDADKSIFKLTGKCNVDLLKNMKVSPSITFGVKNGVEVAHMGIQATSRLDGSLINNIFKIATSTDMLGGSVNFDLSQKLALNKSFDVKKLNPFKAGLGITNLKFKREMLQKILYPENKGDATLKSSEKDQENAEAKQILNNKQAPFIPSGRLKLEWKNILIGQEKFQGTGNIVIKKNVVNTKINFSAGQGGGKITNNTRLGINLIITKFALSLKALNISVLSAFLPPNVDKVEGIFNGKVLGNAIVAGEKVTYNANVDVLGKQGTIKGLNIKEHIEGYIKKISALKKQANKKIDIDGAFDKLVLKGKFTDKRYDLKKIDFIGIKKKILVDGSGTIYPPPSKQVGTINLSFKDNMNLISKNLEKQTGSNVLPVRLKGPGFDLKADYGYTVSRLAKGVLKKQQKKIQKKILNKVLKGNKGKLNNILKKKNINKLFKGLF